MSLKFGLGGSDRAASAMDEIASHLQNEIRGLLEDVEEDVAFLDSLLAYLHAFACLSEGTNRYVKSSIDFDLIESVVLAAHDRRLIVDRADKITISEEGDFIGDLLNRIRAASI